MTNHTVPVGPISKYGYEGVRRTIKNALGYKASNDEWTMVKSSAQSDDIVQVVFPTEIEPEFQEIFVESSLFWISVIGETNLGAISFSSDVSINNLGSCGNFPGSDFVLPANTPLNILIISEVTEIDGQGSILGSAGPCAIDSQGFPRVGKMRFDVEDIQQMVQSGTFDTVIKHEMGHVLGIGTLWGSLVQNPCTQDPCNTNPTYIGAKGKEGFADLGGSGNIPVANTGGPGTANGHWRESTFQRELMTGFVDSGSAPNPFSIMTAKSLIDLGYTVDINTAEAFSVDFSGGTVAPTSDDGVDLGPDTEPIDPEEISPFAEFFLQFQDEILYSLGGLLILIIILCCTCMKSRQKAAPPRVVYKTGNGQYVEAVAVPV